MTDKIHALESPPNEKQIAKDYETGMRERLEDLCAFENRAMSEGFLFSYTVGFNAFGRKALQTLSVLKQLT